MHNLFISITIFVFLSGCKYEEKPKEDRHSADKIVPIINYSITKEYNHDTTLFTEGLQYYEGKLYESSGSPEEVKYTNSVLGYTNLNTGKFYNLLNLDNKIYFGEGFVILKGKIFWVTYKNQLGFIYEFSSSKKIGEFKFENKEGWGMTTDGKYLIMSDGTNKLTYFDPENPGRPIKTLVVSESGFYKEKINEIEFIKGFIYANIWLTNEIIKIDPNTGEVVGKLDLSSIGNQIKSEKPNSDVLNGIAYDSLSDKVFITGKLWPKIFEINFKK